MKFRAGLVGQSYKKSQFFIVRYWICYLYDYTLPARAFPVMKYTESGKVRQIYYFPETKGPPPLTTDAKPSLNVSIVSLPRGDLRVSSHKKKIVAKGILHRASQPADGQRAC